MRSRPRPTALAETGPAASTIVQVPSWLVAGCIARTERRLPDAERQISSRTSIIIIVSATCTIKIRRIRRMKPGAATTSHTYGKRYGRQSFRGPRRGRITTAPRDSPSARLYLGKTVSSNDRDAIVRPESPRSRPNDRSEDPRRHFPSVADGLRGRRSCTGKPSASAPRWPRTSTYLSRNRPGHPSRLRSMATFDH